jgi:peptidyl-prolyl cis-trans isomerase D
MLKQLRHKKTAKRIFIFLAIIIVPAFALWGAGSFIRDRSSASFAGEIFGKKISLPEYRDAFMAVRSQAIIQFGDNFSQVASLLDLETRAWERLILLYKIKQKRIRINDEKVVAVIAGYPFFQKNGIFNEELYSQILRYGLGITAKDFERHVRESLQILELFNQNTAGLKVTDEEVLSEFKKENEKIRVAYISFNNADFTQEISANEEEAKRYFEQHKKDFLTEVAINIEYLKSEIPQNASSQEKQDAKNKLLSLAAKAKNDNNWQEISKTQALEYKTTGFFRINEPIPGIGWSEEFYKALSLLKPGVVSDLIETNQGLFLVRILGVQEPQLPGFAEVKDKAVEALKAEKAKIASLAEAQRYKAIMEEKLRINPSADFKTMAKELKLEVKQTETFSRNQYLQGIGMSKEFSKESFSLINNTKTIALTSTPVASFILKLTEYLPADLEKLKKEGNEYRLRLEEEKKEKAFVEFLEKIKREAHLKSNLAQSKKIAQRY